MNNRARIIRRVLISLFLTIVIFIVMDYSLVRAVYKLYYGESAIAAYFEEQAENVFEASVRVNAFRLILYRAVYSMLPIFLSIFIFICYRSRHLPDGLLKFHIFEKNENLSKLFCLERYVIAFAAFYYIIIFRRDYYYSTFHNCLIGYVPDYFRLILGCIIFLLLTCELKRILFDIRNLPHNHPYITNSIFILVVSVISFCIMEFQIGSKTRVFVYLIHTNIMYWVLLQLFFLVITHNPKIGAIISLSLSYVIGLANDIVFQFRGNYIMFGDLTVVRTALEVAGKYDYRPGMWFWISLGLFIISLTLLILVKLPKKDKMVAVDGKKAKKVLKRIVITLVCELLLVLFVIVTFRSGRFYGNVFGVGWDYNDNVTAVGYLPYFFSNMDSTVRIRLEGYSAEAAKTALEEKDETEKEPVALENAEPNIIIIQNEAFADLRIIADMETDVDTMPFINSLHDNTQKGYLNMSVTGGPTANTEFEVLTRSSLQFLPYGAVPYTQYLKRDTASIARVLKAQNKPYNTVAYHSYYASGYNRNSVYDYLGFDRKEFEENFLDEYSESDLPRGYLSDEANYRNLIKLYEENKETGSPFFCFNVTIQGHGGYTGGPYDLGEQVKVTNFDATESILTYLSSVRLSDAAFQKLIEYFRQVDEPTIIFMYGDHQPSFDDEAKAVLSEHPAWGNGAEQMVSPYYVPYVIWANYDIEEYDGLIPWGIKASEKDKWDYAGLNKLSTNYISSYVLQLAGVRLSVYDNFLLKLHEEVPSITAIGIWDESGNHYDSPTSSPYAEQLHDLEIIQYNLLFDDENCLTEYFIPDDD